MLHVYCYWFGYTVQWIKAYLCSTQTSCVFNEGGESAVRALLLLGPIQIKKSQMTPKTNQNIQCFHISIIIVTLFINFNLIWMWSYVCDFLSKQMCPLITRVIRWIYHALCAKFNIIKSLVYCLICPCESHVHLYKGCLYVVFQGSIFGPLLFSLSIFPQGNIGQSYCKICSWRFSLQSWGLFIHYCVFYTLSVLKT